jgi:hypothetical protein
MKIRTHLIFKFLMLIGVLICTGQSSFSQCKAKQIMKACKPNIKAPFKYDSYAISDFTFTDKEKNVEVQFTAFQGVKYKIVFCTSGFEEPLKLDIWDKSNKVKKNRNKVYDNDQGIDNNFWSFEPTKSGNYFIEYTVPVSNNPGVVKEGCVIMLISFVETSASNND